MLKMFPVVIESMVEPSHTFHYTYYWYSLLSTSANISSQLFDSFRVLWRLQTPTIKKNKYVFIPGGLGGILMLSITQLWNVSYKGSPTAVWRSTAKHNHVESNLLLNFQLWQTWKFIALQALDDMYFLVLTHPRSRGPSTYKFEMAPPPTRSARIDFVIWCNKGCRLLV